MFGSDCFAELSYTDSASAAAPPTPVRRRGVSPMQDLYTNAIQAEDSILLALTAFVISQEGPGAV